MSRYKPPTIEEIGLANHLGDQYDLFVRCMDMKVSVSETARKIGYSRQQTFRFKQIWEKEL